ncbi:PriCT-2 domain-containing protein, partial [Burkholderia ambifaria]
MRAALSHVPADDRDTWVQMGMAIKAEFGEAGFDFWD